MVGRFLSDEYAGGSSDALEGCGWGVLGGNGASRLGGIGGGGVCVAESVAGCCGSGGGDCTTMSVGILVREHGRLREPLRLNSFMRFVLSVRRNWMVKSAAQFSGNSPCGCRCGTGFRRGTPLLSAMPWALVSSAVGGVNVEEKCGCWRRDEGDEVGPCPRIAPRRRSAQPENSLLRQRRWRFPHGRFRPLVREITTARSIQRWRWG
jgi:hypothetical protein